MDRPLTLLLVSPTRFGKTAWARSLGKHIYWHSEFSLKRFHEDAQYAIMDDIVFPPPNPKAWWGAQLEFEQSDKYMPKRHIHWGKPLIFLANPDTDPRHSIHWNTWFSDNCIAVDLLNKLY